ASQVSTAARRCGTSAQVRARPRLVERISPAFSRTRRCCMNEGKAMSNGLASSETLAGERHRRSTTRQRVGSASARKMSLGGGGVAEAGGWLLGLAPGTAENLPKERIRSGTDSFGMGFAREIAKA